MSNRNFERMILVDNLLTLIENPDVESTNEQAALTLEIQERMNPSIESVCPLCNRIYHAGDALCNCHPAMTKSVRVAGEKRVRGVKCPLRVNQTATNRHETRSRTRFAKREQRKFNSLLRAFARRSSVMVQSGKFDVSQPNGIAE